MTTTKPQSTTEPKLAPCPFCDGEAFLTEDDVSEYPTDGKVWHVTCLDSCPVAPGVYAQQTKEDAIRKWNTRAVKSQHELLCDKHRDEFTVFYVGGCVKCWQENECASPPASAAPVVDKDRALEFNVLTTEQKSVESVEQLAYWTWRKLSGLNFANISGEIEAAINHALTAFGKDAFTAYNQAVEDAKAAIREAPSYHEDDDYCAASFINAIARKCSPHVYVNRLAAAAPVEQSSIDNVIVVVDALRNQWEQERKRRVELYQDLDLYYDGLVKAGELILEYLNRIRAQSVAKLELPSPEYWNRLERD